MENEFELGRNNAFQFNIKLRDDWEDGGFLIDPGKHSVCECDGSEIFIDNLSGSAVSISDNPFVMSSLKMIFIFEKKKGSYHCSP